MNRHSVLLFATAEDEADRGTCGGRWQFSLESTDGSERLQASDIEEDAHGERLELLAVVRGLEALDRPSCVTLVTTSRQVAWGIRHGLEAWRSNRWHWEHLGRWVPIKNADLWRRVDRALEFHDVRCQCVAEAGAWWPESSRTQHSWPNRAGVAWRNRAAYASEPALPQPRFRPHGAARPPARGWRGLWRELAQRLAWRGPARSLAS